MGDLNIVDKLLSFIYWAEPSLAKPGSQLIPRTISRNGSMSLTRPYGMPHWAVQARQKRPMMVAREFLGRSRRKLTADCRSAHGADARGSRGAARIQRLSAGHARACRSRCFLGVGRPGRSAKIGAFREPAHQTGIVSDIATGGPRARPRRLGLLARTRRASIASAMLSSGSAQISGHCQATAGLLYRCTDETKLAETDQRRTVALDCAAWSGAGPRVGAA